MSCCGGNKAPSLPRQFVSATGVLFRAAKNKAAGKPVEVDPALSQARLNFCETCEFVQKYDWFRLCKACGCGLNGRMKRKAFLNDDTLGKEKCEKWIEIGL